MKEKPSILDELHRKNQFLILFDGVCNLCNTSVDFIIQKDPKEQYVFASLQSEIGEQILAYFGKSNAELDSVILIKHQSLYEKSTAALLVARTLKGWPKLLAPFIYLPKGLRNWVYDHIAQNRYVWFGKKDTCRLPTPEERARFL